MKSVSQLMWVFVCALAAASANPAAACSSSAGWRSVVLNAPPEIIPEGATLYRIRFDETYIVDAGPRRSYMQGIRGVLVDAAGNMESRTPVEIKSRISLPCSSWFESWSSDHDISDGVITGYVVASIVGFLGDRAILSPWFYLATKYRGDGATDGQSRGLNKRGGRSAMRSPMTGGTWRPLRLDAQAMTTNLERTNRAINTHLDQAVE